MGNDYTKFSREEKKRPNVVRKPVAKETAPEKEPVPEKEPEAKKEIAGIVTNCVRLNVRKEPNFDADILCTIDVSTNLIIDEEESTDEFYKICTSAGIEVYCVKTYITIVK